jgi:hypothetical protein
MKVQKNWGRSFENIYQFPLRKLAWSNNGS